MSPATLALLAGLGGWLAFGLPEAALALAALGLLFDLPFELGGLTVYSSEALLGGLALGALFRLGPRAMLERIPGPALTFSLAWMAWLAAHGLRPGPLWGGAKAALRAGELLLGLALPLWLGFSGRALSAALLAASLAAAWGLAQAVAGPGAWLNAGREAELLGGFQAAAAGMGHHNQLGAYLAAALPLALASATVPRWRRGALAAAALCALALAATLSRGAWAGLGLGALAALPLLPRPAKGKVLAALALAAALLFLGPSQALRERAQRLLDDPDRAHLRELAMQVWDDQLQWGRGPGVIERELPALAAMPGRPDAERAFGAHLHNTWLQWGVEFGLLAALLPLALLAWLAGQAWGLRGRAWPFAAALMAAVTAFAAQGMTDVLTLHARGAALGLWWGLALAALWSAQGPPSSPRTADRAGFELLGERYFQGGLQAACDWLLAGARGSVHAANVHTTVAGWMDAELAQARRQAAALLPDGRPLSLAARLKGRRGALQVRGADLMRLACQKGQARGIRHYFYGGAPGVAKAAVGSLRALAPRLKVAGVESPPFRAISDAELLALCRRLRRSRSQVLWVGLGAPKQELLMERLRRLGAPCAMVGVGAAFDFAAGAKAEAPGWMRRSGLEWLHRLLSEPERLAGRYLLTNPLFILALAADALGLWRPPEPAPRRGAAA